jgi:hypothetical protein
MSTAIVVLVVLYFVGAPNIIKLVRALKTCTDSVVREIVDETAKEITTK